jgi:hypothetical protein
MTARIRRWGEAMRVEGVHLTEPLALRRRAISTGVVPVRVACSRGDDSPRASWTLYWIVNFLALAATMPASTVGIEMPAAVRMLAILDVWGAATKSHLPFGAATAST